MMRIVTIEIKKMSLRMKGFFRSRTGEMLGSNLITPLERFQRSNEIGFFSVRASLG